MLIWESMEVGKIWEDFREGETIIKIYCKEKAIFN